MISLMDKPKVASTYSLQGERVIYRPRIEAHPNPDLPVRVFMHP